MTTRIVREIIRVFCSPFESGDRSDSELWVAAQIVFFENRLHVAGAVAGDCGDLRLACVGNREPRDGGSAKVMKRQARYPRPLTRLPP